MRTAKNQTGKNSKLPGRFEDLVLEMPPRAIADDVQHRNAVEMIDRLMMLDHPTRGQADYLETLVQLVQVYENAHHAIEGLKGARLLKHLSSERGMNASALARLLGLHTSMGSKILSGEREITIEHARTLADYFKIRFDAFLA